jgi:hypothetical protein
MTKLYDRLYVGSEADCFHSRPEWAVVLACRKIIGTPFSILKTIEKTKMGAVRTLAKELHCP